MGTEIAGAPAECAMETGTVDGADGGPQLTRRGLIALTAGLAAAWAGPAVAGPLWGREPKVAPFNPAWRADHLVVKKGDRSLYVLNAGKTLRKYQVALGFAPQGHKFASGDGRTPEGRYWIDRRNPRSEFYLSLGISYPNAMDVARARSLGHSPGGDIFIHGEPMRGQRRGGRDWTAGCIAVRNDEIEELWAMVPTGVPITILA